MQNSKSHVFFCAKDSSSFRKTSQSVLHLNSAAYQESLVAPTLDNKLPQETGKGFCVVFLSAGDQWVAFDYRVQPWGVEGGHV